MRPDGYVYLEDKGVTISHEEYLRQTLIETIREARHHLDTAERLRKESDNLREASVRAEEDANKQLTAGWESLAKATSLYNDLHGTTYDWNEVALTMLLEAHN